MEFELITQGIKAVCFDAFGTLVEISDKRNPYTNLFRQLGCKSARAKEMAMTLDVDIEKILQQLGISGLDSSLGKLFQAEVQIEIDSIRLLPSAGELLCELKNAGIKIWVVSNLARPYGDPLMQVLDGRVDGFSLSYKVGAVKPAPLIFSDACGKLDSLPHQVLFIGDHPRNDLAGAQAFGMKALLSPVGGVSLFWFNHAVRQKI